MPEEHLHQGPIYVKKSPIHGYGVFASEDIEKDCIIEECHALFSSSDDPEFYNYYFKHPDKSALPLGYGCIYNHSDTPNIAFDYDPDTQLFYFYTIQAVRQGEELCSSYGKNWFSRRRLKTRATPWYHRLTHFSKGIPFRAVLVFCGSLVFLQGLKYLSS